jgi:succinylglutamate desuccinylase
MLNVLEALPAGFLDAPVRELYRVLAGPSLIHLPGRRNEPLFVCVLLHGNEDTGFKAMQTVLRKYQGQPLPRALSLFVGNVAAAREGLRRLEQQPDYNRVWPGADTAGQPEHAMMDAVVEQMRSRGVFASIDIHNNTGLNPHYGCVNRLDPPFLQLATLFSRTVVYFKRPLGVQSAAFASLCPAVTLECGKPGNQPGEAHAAAFVEAALHLAEFSQRPVAAQDLDLFHTVGVVKVAPEVTFGFEHSDAQLRLEPDLDHMNFRELPAGTRFGFATNNRAAPLQVIDENGRRVEDQFFELRKGEVLLKRRSMPAMLTTDARIVRQDCLCYLMERLSLGGR